MPSEEDKIKKVDSWFNKLNAIVENKGILLMNIYELEALILADIETFNKLYNTSISYSSNVMFQNDPKGFLVQKTSKNKKQYQESHCPALFEKLNIEIVIAKCDYFKKFYDSFKLKVGL